MPNKRFSHRMLHGGGGGGGADLLYGLKQAEHFLQLKTRRN